MTGQVITIAQQKGGAGKTTIAANICVALANAGARVALIDTDPQGSLGRWYLARFERGAGAGIELATASAWGVGYEIGKLSASFDYVIVDTPPKADSDLRPALRAADLVLVPVSVSQLDIWATEGLLDLIAREKADALVVLNRFRAGTNLGGEVAASAAEFGAEIAAQRLGNRIAYAETMGDGGSVMDAARHKLAAGEIAALTGEIRARLGAKSTLSKSA